MFPSFQFSYKLTKRKTELQFVDNFEVMAGQVLTKTCGILMMVTLVLFMAQLSFANPIDICVKQCPNECLKESKLATPDICKKACEKMCDERQWNNGKYIVTRKQPKSIICRWMNYGCP